MRFEVEPLVVDVGFEVESVEVVRLRARHLVLAKRLAEEAGRGLARAKALYAGGEYGEAYRVAREAGVLLRDRDGYEQLVGEWDW